MPKQKDPYNITKLFKDYEGKPEEEDFYSYDFGNKEEPEIKEVKHEDVPKVEKPKKNKQTLSYKDEKGKVLERHTMTPVSDIKRLTQLGWAFLIYIVIMTIYIIYNNVVNNLVAAFAC